jgi:hypothetical protein
MLVISPVSPYYSRQWDWPSSGVAQTPASLGLGPVPCPHTRREDAAGSSQISLRITQFSGHAVLGISLGWGVGAMQEDASSKAERYRRAANRYGEMAKEAEPGYLAEVFRKVAVRYVFMAEDTLREAERRGRWDRTG